MSKTLASLVFTVGLGGFASLLFGIAYWSAPLAFVVGGVFAIWWSWYVSIGAALQLRKSSKPAAGDDA